MFPQVKIQWKVDLDLNVKMLKCCSWVPWTKLSRFWFSSTFESCWWKFYKYQREEKRTGLQFHLNFCLSELASPANVEYEKEKVWQMWGDISQKRVSYSVCQRKDELLFLSKLSSPGVWMWEMESLINTAKHFLTEANWIAFHAEVDVTALLNVFAFLFCF